MQYRVIFFLFSCLIAGAGRSLAQHQAAITEENVTTDLNDSLILLKDKQLATRGTAPKYGPIFLAGSKSYYGEKTDYVNDYVRRYLELHNGTLNYVQAAKDQPFSLIDKVLEKKKLPKELKYLAVIESALNRKAVSRVGAVGPWQLMAPTARMLGLSVNSGKDERTDWSRSTMAATRYLEILYDDLQDWLLVIAAYNSGPVPVQKAIARTGSHNFWDIKQYLPRETQGHVLAFIATASIFERLDKFIDLGSIPLDFSFTGTEELPPLKKDKKGPAIAAATMKTAGKKALSFTQDELQNMTIVRITTPLSLELMAAELSIDKSLLERWNPDYDMYVMDSYPTPFYNLRFPKDKQSAFIAKKDDITRKSQAVFSQVSK